MVNNDITKQDIDLFKKLRSSPIFFIYTMWGLVPQPLKPEYKIKMQSILLMDGENWVKGINNVRADWFCPFEKGKHITWQQWIILLCVEKAIRNEASRKISIASGHGIGKFVRDTETIWKCSNDKVTPVQAKEIKIGDNILGREKPTKVIGVYPQKESHESFKVTFDDGSSLDVGNPHLWAVRGRQERRKKTKEWRVMTTKDIYEAGVKRKNGTKECRQWEIPQQKVKGFKEYKNAYVIGIWYGDGSVGCGKYTKSDLFIKEKISKLGWNVKSSNGIDHYVHGLITELKKIRADFNNKEYLPPDFMSWNIESRIALLRGLCDTDGTIQDRNIEFGTIHKGLADDVLLLIRSLGGKGRIKIKENPQYTYKNKTKTGKRYYRVSFQTPFNPFLLPRKAKLWKKPQERYLTRWIESIEKIEKIENGICFKVESKDELFLAGKELIVTHNTADLSWLILWFLFVNYNSQVPCTAPTADQMYDVLWKELSLWINRMPESVKLKYDWSRDHIRIKESPETWFARAKTSSKENSEALAGVHADHVLTVADEASAVEERIFNTAEGAWTSGDILVILISNPTRNEGYFYDTHHKLKDKWQTLTFSSIESPVVDSKYEENIAERHGRDSVEYGIRVLGKFPNEGEMDDSGYVSMFTEDIINTQPDFGEELTKWHGIKILGVDPSGEGDDKTSFYLRDNTKAKKIYEEVTSNSKGIAEKIVTFADQYNISPRNIIVDSFGVGADVAKEVAILSKGRMNIYSVNVGDPSDRESDQELYANKRAEMYSKLRKWLRQGGEIIENQNTEEELRTIKFKRNSRGRIQIMPKVDMKKKYGFKSPNDADALALTFLRNIIEENSLERKREEIDMEDWDPFSVL